MARTIAFFNKNTFEAFILSPYGHGEQTIAKIAGNTSKQGGLIFCLGAYLIGSYDVKSAT